MAAATSFEGFSFAAILAAARAQPVGAQKQTYAQGIIDVITSMPLYKIEVSGQVKYRATISNPLAASSVGIVLPPEFSEPPSISLAEPLTDALEVIEHPTNPSIRIVTPIKIGGGVAHVTADKALVAGQAIRTLQRRLLSPAILDQGGGGTSPPPSGPPPAGTPTILLDDLIANMRQASVTIPTFNGTQHNKKQAGGYASSYGTTKAIIDAGPTLTYRSYDYMDEILPWFWAYAADSHNDALECRLQYSAGAVSVLSTSTGIWYTTSPAAGNTFNGYVWDGNDQTPQPYNTLIDLEDFGDFHDHSDGSRSSRFTGNYGAELWYTGLRNRSIIADSRAVALVARARVIDKNYNPYYGTGASYAVTLGFDFYARAMSQLGIGQRQSNGTWGTLIDGFSNRWVTVTNGDWKTVAMVTMDPYNTDPGNANIQDWDADFEWCLPPWTLTEAQIRANPPPWATT